MGASEKGLFIKGFKIFRYLMQQVFYIPNQCEMLKEQLCTKFQT